MCLSISHTINPHGVISLDRAPLMRQPEGEQRGGPAASRGRKVRQGSDSGIRPYREVISGMRRTKCMSGFQHSRDWDNFIARPKFCPSILTSSNRSRYRPSAIGCRWAVTTPGSNSSNHEHATLGYPVFQRLYLGSFNRWMCDTHSKDLGKSSTCCARSRQLSAVSFKERSKTKWGEVSSV